MGSANSVCMTDLTLTPGISGFSVARPLERIVRPLNSIR